MLEVQFAGQGYEVTIERSVDRALRCLDAEKYDVVVSEVHPVRRPGVRSVASHARKLAREGALDVRPPPSELSRPSTVGSSSGQRTTSWKPASAAVVVAKASRAIADSRAKKPGGRGVSGSLQEMALPDVIQILGNGRKSGLLKVSNGRLQGVLMFQDGSIHDARFGDLGGAEGGIRNPSPHGG